MYTTEDYCRLSVAALLILKYTFPLPLLFWDVIFFKTCLVFSCGAGNALQIQCYQCDVKHNDCSTPEYVVNCTVNVQDMCQKEVLVKPDGEFPVM